MADGERHKFGKSVLILEFKNVAGETKNIVYKPAPLTASALLVGDVQRLKMFAGEFEGHESLLEIFNESLDHPLQTYLIWPCYDLENTQSSGRDNIDAHYGFMEFITHAPWEEPDYEQETQQVLQQLEPAERAYHLVQEAIDANFMKSLRKAAKDKSCDYIAHSKREIQQYSFDCGFLVAFMTLAGDTDMHCENLLLSKCRPVLLDVEVCLNPTGFSIEDTLCFDMETGSMLVSGKSPKKNAICLFDICGSYGHYPHALNHIEKNRMFRLFQETGDHLEACQPDPICFMKGYRAALNVIAQKSERIHRWLKSPQLNNAILRFLPFETREFNLNMFNRVNNNFSETSFANSTKMILEDSAGDYLRNQREFSSLSQEDNEWKPMPLPDYAIYSDPNSISYIWQEYCLLSIPWFYCYANATCLYTGDGRTIQFPELPEGIEGIANIDMSLLPQNTHYLPMSPLAFINARVDAMLIHRDDLAEKAEEELNNFLNCAAKKHPLELCLPRVNLNAQISENMDRAVSSDVLVSLDSDESVEDEDMSEDAECTRCRLM